MVARKRLPKKPKSTPPSVEVEEENVDAEQTGIAALLAYASRHVGTEASYDEKFVKIAEMLCARGATDAELATAFDVSTSTIRRWFSQHPEFGAAVRHGKAEIFDPLVERALAQRAVGYSVDVIEHKVVDKVLTPVKVRKHLPPDVTACIFWLKNRNPKQWRDVIAHTHEGAIDITKVTSAELLAQIQQEAAELGVIPAVPNGLKPSAKPGNSKLN